MATSQHFMWQCSIGIINNPLPLHPLYNFLTCTSKPFKPIFFFSSSILKSNLAKTYSKQSVFKENLNTPLSGLYICCVGIRGRNHLLICFFFFYKDLAAGSSSYLGETVLEKSSIEGRITFHMVSSWHCRNRKITWCKHTIQAFCFTLLNNSVKTKWIEKKPKVFVISWLCCNHGSTILQFLT